ncbi:hypothetical protein ACV6EM_09235 [Enterococcus hirae]
MKLILSKCRTNNFSEVSRILNENGYIQIGESRTEPKNNLELFFFFESHEKKQIEWLSELLRFFNVGKADYKEHNIIDDTLYQYNAVIILKTPNNLYAHSLSQGLSFIDLLRILAFKLGTQIIFSTHNRQFFDLCQRKLDANYHNASFIEMNYTENQL